MKRKMERYRIDWGGKQMKRKEEEKGNEVKGKEEGNKNMCHFLGEVM